MQAPRFDCLLSVVASLGLAFGLAACDKKSPTEAARLVCPPQISAVPRRAGAPVDELAGIRPGFSIADVSNSLTCRDAAFRFRFEPSWHTELPANAKGEAARQRMFAERPGELVSLGLVGAAGQEIVAEIWRDVAYAADRAPAADAVQEQLIAHFGPAQDIQDKAAVRDLWWAYDPEGQPLKQPIVQGTDPFSAVGSWISGTWELAVCSRSTSMNPMVLAMWRDECGLTIHARIETAPGDAAKVERVKIMLVDQARLGALVKAFRAKVAPPPAAP